MPGANLSYQLSWESLVTALGVSSSVRWPIVWFSSIEPLAQDIQHVEYFPSRVNNTSDCARVLSY